MNLLRVYEEYLTTEKKASANTVSSYLRDVQQFASAMEILEIPLTEVLPGDVERYAQSLINKGKSAATVTRAMASVKSFYACLQKTGYAGNNPARGGTTTKVERKLPQVLTSKEVELFLEQPSCTDLKGYRDRAMLELLYATGIRVSELIGLQTGDINLGGGFLRCPGKGKERVIPLYPAAIRALSDYMKKVRPQLVNHPEETVLFVNMNGEPMSRQGFWKLVKYYQEKAGTPTGERRGSALHSGDAGTCRHLFHPDLFSTGQSKDQKRLS